MKKKNLLITLLSIVMAVSLSVPVVMAFANEAGSTTVPKMLTVEIFNGNADDVQLENATVADDNGTTVIEFKGDAWATYKIALKNPVDLSGKSDVKLFFEYRATGTTSYAEVKPLHFVSYWNEPVKIAAENLNGFDGYVNQEL